MNSNEIGALTLAYIGDAVYELKVRVHFLDHKKTVAMVRAEAQASAYDLISGILTDAEQSAYRRGRNAKVNSIPAHATVEEYHKATGFEALFGWLYMNGETQRIDELFELIVHGN